MDMKARIEEHLKAQYEGIFTPAQIQSHIDNYIEEEQTNYLIEKIAPFIEKGVKILDVGSGYGSFTLAALKNGYQCTGIELAEFDHKISRERAEKEGVGPNHFIHGSALALPVPDSSVDVVTFWNVLEHVSDYKKAIKEANRVLRKGGKIFIIAPNYFAFRKEAHYHVPWLPLFPRPIARLYLRAIGRKTSFLDNCIFYVTSFGLLRFLRKEGFLVTTDINEKLRTRYKFRSSKVIGIVKFAEKMNLGWLLSKLIFTLKTQPLVSSIDILAIKK
jgi:MPBQ/MSBQ methyltransferase